MKQQLDVFKMSENQVVEKICRWLLKHGYSVRSHCLGYKKGIDIVAVERNSKRILYIEAKGNRKNEPTEKLFTTDQISKHYAVQLAQICKVIHSYRRNALFAIANPNVPRVRKCVESSRTALKRLKIILIWVSPREIKMEKP